MMCPDGSSSTSVLNRKKSVVLIGVLAVVVVIVALLVSGVFAGAKTAIVGKWESEDGTAMQFFKDGTLTSSSGLLPVSGHYSFLDNSHLRIEYDGLFGIGGPKIVGVQIHRRKMTLDFDSGAVELTKSR